MIVVLHLAILYKGLFPFFGRILFPRGSVYLISFCILLLGLLIYGTVSLQKWAWWGALGLITFLTISTVMTFSRHRFYDVILLMDLPAYEMAFIDKLVLIHDFDLGIPLVLPLLAALGLIITSRRYYKNGLIARTPL
jgi:hypothetical protein